MAESITTPTPAVAPPVIQAAATAAANQVLAATPELAKKSSTNFRWTVYVLLALIVAIFGLLIWQLMGLEPEVWCKVDAKGAPELGQACFGLLLKILSIKGWTIWGSLLLVAIVVVALVTVSMGVRVNVSANKEGVNLDVDQDDDKVVATATTASGQTTSAEVPKT